MLKTHLISWFKVPLIFLFLSLSLALESPGQDTDEKEDALLYEIEMGDMDSKEGEKPKFEVDPVAKEQFKFEYFESGPDKRQLYEKYLPKLGAEWMLNWLETLYPACHGQAHDLGQAILAQEKDLGLALMKCRNKCTSGWMHGILMEALKDKSFPEITDQMISFCENKEMKEIHKPGNCAHGIGHALVVITHNDIEKSLAACSTFPDSALGYYCATGVFMEYLVTGKTEKPENSGLHYPCDTYTRYPAACYRYRVPQMLKELDGNYDKVSAECLALSQPTRLGCFHGLGKAAIIPVLKNPKLLADICKYGTSSDQAVCIEGAIEKLADYDRTKAIDACDNLSGESQKVCLAAAQGTMYRLNKPTMGLYTGGTGEP